MAFVAWAAYGPSMSLTGSPLPRCRALQAARRQALLRPRAPFGQVDERFFGPQVPGENRLSGRFRGCCLTG